MFTDKWKKNVSKGLKKKYIFDLEYRKKSRIALLKYIKEKNGGYGTKFNVGACRWIEEYGKLSGYNFKHACMGRTYYK